MIRLKRKTLVEKLRTVEIKNYGNQKRLVNDAMHGKGEDAMAFLVGKGVIKFPAQVVKEEINQMAEKSLINIEQWEQFIALLDNASNGLERVTVFIRKKRRIVVVD